MAGTLRGGCPVADGAGLTTERDRHLGVSFGSVTGEPAPAVAPTESRRESRPRQRFWIASAAIVSVVAPLLLFLFVRWHNPQPYFGDEPHYLLISRSLVVDGDVDVKNDYLTGRYLRYYPLPTGPHVNTSIFTARSPHWYPVHGIGLPALLVPAVRADDADGATVAMVVVAVAVIVLTFAWVRRFVRDVWLAAIAAAALGISPSFLGLQSRIFPDLPTAALLLGCLLLMESSRRKPRHLLLLGSLVGISPWFHFKNGLVFATIGVIALVRIARTTRGRERIVRLVCLAAPALLAVAGYEIAIHAWYGSWSPTRMFPPGNEAFALAPTHGLAAASFDGARGLLTNSPALLLIAIGLPLWARRFPGAFARLMLVLAPTIVIQATFNDWSGGNAPPARYAMQFVPAFVPAIALLLREAPNAVRAVASAILAFGWVLAATFIWLRPAWGYAGERSPFLLAIDGRLGPALDRAMPTYDASARLLRGGWALAGWTLISLLLLAIGISVATNANRTSN